MSRARNIMKKKKPFRRVIARRMSEKTAEKIWINAEKRLDKMLAEYSALPKRVKMHTENFIFPAAAIYLTVKRENERMAYPVMEEAMKKISLKTGKKLRKMARLPGFKRLIIKIWWPVSHEIFGRKAGFRNKFYPSKRNEFMMDILACPYEKYLAELGCPELTVLFCKNDEYCYGNIDGIDFIRTETLGSGGERCDFHIVYRRHK